MSLLLDTCALLALARAELPTDAAAVLRDAAHVHVCVVSPWEIAIQVARGKLRLREPPFRWFSILVERYGLREIPLDVNLACAAAALPPVHGDPFDRAIVALAQAQMLTIVTSDQNIAKYPGVKTVW